MKRVDEERELTRLLNEDASGLTEHVSALRGHVPNALELGALASSLAVRGIGVAPTTPSASPHAWKKWAAGGAGGAAAIALWLAFAPRAADPAATSAVPPVNNTQEQTSAPIVAPSRPGPPRDARPLGQATAAESEVQPSSEAESLPSSSSAAPEARAPSQEPRAKAPGGAQARSTEARAPRALATAPPTSDVATQPTELELLRDARLAIRSSPAAALGLVDRHAQLYPQGKLSQERELIAISALVAMGRRTAALSRAASFERSFPGSAYRKQVEELLR